MYAHTRAGEMQLVVIGEVVHQGSLNWAAPSSLSPAHLRLDYQPRGSRTPQEEGR